MELALTVGLSCSYFNLVALSVHLNSARISVLSCYYCHPSEFQIASEDNIIFLCSYYERYSENKEQQKAS